MCHLKSLVFDCISFTECLITCLSTADSEDPASNRTLVTSVFPSMLPCVEVSCPKTKFKHKQFLIKSSQTTQLYTTKVFL